MKVMRRDAHGETVFVLAEVDARLGQAVLDLGFRRVGREYVRSFPSVASHLDRAYANFEHDAEALVLQAARERPVPWEHALERFLARVAGERVDWWLTGSAALAVRGADVAPRDLDIVTDGAAALRLADLLTDALVEPVVPVEGWICEWWGRAFLGARVEWIGDVLVEVDDPEPVDFGPTAASSLETIEWRGRELRLPALELQLAVAERRGLTERANAARRLRA